MQKIIALMVRAPNKTEKQLRAPNKTEKQLKQQQVRGRPNGYQPYVHIEQANACIDGARQRCARQPNDVFQDE